MTIWLLGGASYVGAHLMTILPDEQVTVVDRNLTPIKNYPVTQVQMDLAEETPDFKDGDVAYVMQTKSNKGSQEDPQSATRDIYVTTYNVVQACERKKVFVIYLSSRIVYGNVRGWIDELHETKPVTVYGELKLQCERLVRATLKNYAVIRLANVYGGYRPYSDYMGVADLFMEAALQDKPLTVEGGSQIYDFSFIDEVIHALKKVPSNSARNYTVQFTSGKPIEVGSLAYLM